MVMNSEEREIILASITRIYVGKFECSEYIEYTAHRNSLKFIKKGNFITHVNYNGIDHFDIISLIKDMISIDCSIIDHEHLVFELICIALSGNDLERLRRAIIIIDLLYWTTIRVYSQNIHEYDIISKKLIDEYDNLVNACCPFIFYYDNTYIKVSYVEKYGKYYPEIEKIIAGDLFDISYNAYELNCLKEYNILKLI